MTRFSDWMIAENLQVFWAAKQHCEFITDAAEQAGTYRKKGALWLVGWRGPTASGSGLEEPLPVVYGAGGDCGGSCGG
jgi:hypothetical protein